MGPERRERKVEEITGCEAEGDEGGGGVGGEELLRAVEGEADGLGGDGLRIGELGGEEGLHIGERGRVRQLHAVRLGNAAARIHGSQPELHGLLGNFCSFGSARQIGRAHV